MALDAFARLESALSHEARFASDAAHELRTPVAVILAETLAITMQTLGLPNELMQMIPYVVPIVILTIWTARGRAKRAALK